MVAIESPVETGEGLGARLKRLVRDAYLNPQTRVYGFVFDLTAFLVMISLLSMVLEGIPEIGERYEEVFFYCELIVVSLFIVDYAASIYTASNRLGYVFSFWGLIDLLAILPFFLTFTNITGMRAGRTLHTLRSMRATRALRALRVLRVVRVAKLIKKRNDAARLEASDSTGSGGHGGHGSHAADASMWRDFQFGLVAVCSVIALAEVLLEWEHDQLFWLLLGGGAAANLAIRRAFLRRGWRDLATGVAVAGFAIGTYFFYQAYEVGDSKAVVIALTTVTFITGSLLTHEYPVRRPAPALAV